MKCPFRLVLEYEYGTLEGTPVVVKQTEAYPDCYEDCACHKYDVAKGGYYCIQADILGEQIEDADD